MTALSFRDLHVWFGEGRDRVEAVRGATFDIAAGDSFGLVGESGSGKSTIMRALVGLAPNWSGEMLVDDRPVQTPRPQSFYRTVQMVFQDPYASLHPRHTVDRVLMETLGLHRIQDRERRVRDLLEQVGLGPQYRFRHPHQLSGGQRQRVAIARALAPNPSVLLLDEPTSALDVSVQAEILNLLSDLRRDHGLTFFMVSHDLPVIAHLCDRIAVMQQGRIVETLSRDDMRSQKTEHPYTASLLSNSIRYQRQS